MTTSKSPKKASPTPGTSTSGTTSVTDEVKESAQKLVEGASEKGASYAEDAKETAVSYAEGAKETVAQEGENVASALRKAADEMRSGSPQERTLGQIADGIADASEAIRDKDLGQIVGDLNNFARRNPTVFLSGAALVGFAAVRFAKASKSGASMASERGTPHQASKSGSLRTGPSRQAGTAGSDKATLPSTGERS